MAATELMDEIVATSQRIRAARMLDGQRPKRVDATFRLLQAIERTSYCLSIADVGRTLRMSRQGAHKVVKQAAVAALVELRPNRDDRRTLQLALTARGRAELAGAAADEGAWLIRHRLARDERLTRRTPGP